MGLAPYIMSIPGNLVWIFFTKKEGGTFVPPSCKCQILAEVSLKQTSKCFSVSCLVSCHLMYSVMDCIEVRSLCTLCEVGLASGSTVLCLYAHLKVLLGAVSNDFTEELCKFCCMLSLFVSCLLPVETDFRIALSVSDS